MSDTMFTCVDPTGLRHEPKFTETAGMITGSADNGYFTTSRPEVAEELKVKYPHMLVTEHTPYGGKATRSISWTVPELPWKRNQPNGTRAEQQAAHHTLEAPTAGAVTPPEVITDGESTTK